MLSLAMKEGKAFGHFESLLCNIFWYACFIAALFVPG